MAYIFALFLSIFYDNMLHCQRSYVSEIVLKTCLASYQLRKEQGLQRWIGVASNEYTAYKVFFTQSLRFVPYFKGVETGAQSKLY